MGAFECALLAIAGQLTNAAVVFCTKASPLVNAKLGKLGFDTGAQLATNLNKLASAGLTAAVAEFGTTQAAEKQFVTVAAALPPIT